MIVVLGLALAILALAVLEYVLLVKRRRDYHIEKAQVELEYSEYDRNLRESVLWFNMRRGNVPVNGDREYRREYRLKTQAHYMVLERHLGTAEAQRIAKGSV